MPQLHLPVHVIQLPQTLQAKTMFSTFTGITWTFVSRNTTQDSHGRELVMALLGLGWHVHENICALIVSERYQHRQWPGVGFPASVSLSVLRWLQRYTLLQLFTFLCVFPKPSESIFLELIIVIHIGFEHVWDENDGHDSDWSTGDHY